jgi:hypothetical protein
MSLLEEVSSILEAAGIRHALIGALALSAYGVNRATVDLDLFAADASCLRPDLWASLQDRGIAFEIRKGDLTDPLAGVVRFQAPGENPLDVVVGKFPWQARLLERAEPVGGTLVVRAAELRAAIELLESAHRLQVRALELTWTMLSQESAAPAAALPAEPKVEDSEGDLLTVISRCPDVFDRNDVCRQLGFEPERSTLYRALQALVADGVLTIHERGMGRVPTPLRETRIGFPALQMAILLLQMTIRMRQIFFFCCRWSFE